MIALEKLQLLVNLARADDNLAQDEKQFIKNIGKAHGYPESSVETLFYETHPINIPEKITDEQRVDFAISLTQLMLLDKKMFLKEIEYCSHLIEMLGFEKRFVYKLIEAVSEEGHQPQQLETIRKEAFHFLKTE
jgi:uncharacterized tellurite resistance protein B-like protein